MTRKYSLGEEAQIVRFPSNPELVKQLKKDETFLIKELDRVETYDERVEIRKDLRNIREELYEAIKYAD